MIYEIYDKDEMLIDILNFKNEKDIKDYKKANPTHVLVDVTKFEFFNDDDDDEDEHFTEDSFLLL